MVVVVVVGVWMWGYMCMSMRACVCAYMCICWSLTNHTMDTSTLYVTQSTHTKTPPPNKTHTHTQTYRTTILCRELSVHIQTPHHITYNTNKRYISRGFPSNKRRKKQPHGHQYVCVSCMVAHNPRWLGVGICWVIWWLDILVCNVRKAQCKQTRPAVELPQACYDAHAIVVGEDD